jgi:hypothetical protein
MAASALLAIGARWAAGWAMPAWAVYSWAAMIFLCVQATLLAAILSFTMIAGRSNMSFIPLRDGQYFVRSITELRRRSEIPSGFAKSVVLRA